MAVSSLSLALPNPAPLVEAEAENWYGLQTRPRHEKIVAHRLEERGVKTFLPLVTEVHRWSDRKKSVEVPLFRCYVFAKFVPNRAERLRVLPVDGVFGLVGARGEGTHSWDGKSIRFERHRRATALVFSSVPQDRTARRQFAASGALDGLEGIRSRAVETAH